MHRFKKGKVNNMKISIYLSNLARFTEGRENGRWLQLPMNPDYLKKVFNDIVGENQEWIILDYNAPFEISEYENVFALNEFVENINECGIDDDDVLKAILTVADSKEDALEAIEDGTFSIVNVDEVSKDWSCPIDYEELFGMVLNEAGFNNLFSESIPEEMYDYINFSQIWTALSVNDGWQPVDVNNVTYLVTLY